MLKTVSVWNLCGICVEFPRAGNPGRIAMPGAICSTVCRLSEVLQDLRAPLGIVCRWDGERWVLGLATLCFALVDVLAVSAGMTKTSAFDHSYVG